MSLTHLAETTSRERTQSEHRTEGRLPAGRQQLRTAGSYAEGQSMVSTRSDREGAREPDTSHGYGRNLVCDVEVPDLGQAEVTLTDGSADLLPAGLAEHLAIAAYHPAEIPRLRPLEVDLSNLPYDPAPALRECDAIALDVAELPGWQEAVRTAHGAYRGLAIDQVADVWFWFESEASGAPMEALLCNPERRNELTGALAVSSGELADEAAIFARLEALKGQADAAALAIVVAAEELTVAESDVEHGQVTVQLGAQQADLGELQARSDRIAGYIIDIGQHLVRGDLMGALGEGASIAGGVLRDEVLQPFLSGLIDADQKAQLETAIATLQQRQAELRTTSDTALLRSRLVRLGLAETQARNLETETSTTFGAVMEQLGATSSAMASSTSQAMTPIGGAQGPTFDSLADLANLRLDMLSASGGLLTTLAEYQGFLGTSPMSRAAGLTTELDAWKACMEGPHPGRMGIVRVQDMLEDVDRFQQTESANVAETLDGVRSFDGIQAVNALGRAMQDRMDESVIRCAGVMSCE